MKMYLWWVGDLEDLEDSGAVFTCLLIGKNAMWIQCLVYLVCLFIVTQTLNCRQRHNHALSINICDNYKLDVFAITVIPILY